jgi:hypothetical protein
MESQPTLHAVGGSVGALRYRAQSAVSSGTLSDVCLNPSGLWTCTTPQDTFPSEKRPDTAPSSQEM